MIVVGFSFESCSKSIYSEKDKGSHLEKVEKPYLLLISLDGFRWDYVEKYHPPHLTKFINEGVKAESLIPSYPSKTFPNHYTIATGMYPDHHGLLGNLFYHYDKEKMYSIRDRSTVEDGSFYKGSPIWVEASKAGMVTASYFFVGTEANINGVHPTYYFNFDNKVSKEERIGQVLKWFAMPEAERPQLVAMYFADMDNAGHRYGPNNEEVIGETLLQLDSQLGNLFEGITNTGLPVNIIIVSDHGMTEVPVDHYIAEEMLQKEEWFLMVNNGSIVNIHPKPGISNDSIYQYLKAKEDHFKVYFTTDVPYFETPAENNDWGAIQVIPDEGYYFVTARSIGMRKSIDQKVFGQHGFRPEMKDMHAIFYANGPAFKEGVTVPSFKNIHIMPLMCFILGLEIPNNIDGDFNAIKTVLKE
jgi:predicted AlkP superfamily pyrophosphatase or phosphodiesterase